MKKLYLILIIGMFISSSAVYAKNTPINLKCENQINPLGVDAVHPRLQWNVKNETNYEQKSFQIMVGTDSLALLRGNAQLFNYTSSSDSMFIVYNGAPLSKFTKYYWKVILWDENNNQATSSIASFETGVFNTQWQGSWISDGKSIHEKLAPYFRKEIQITKPIASARAYIVAAGLFELSINGNKISKNLLEPAYTRFEKRMLYSTFDITQQLQKGNNAIGVILGNGWYNLQSLAVWKIDKAVWRKRPSFQINIHITYTDGSEQTIASNNSWKTNSDGPIIFNSIYTGEHYDAQKEIPNWNKVGFNDTAWQFADTVVQPTEKVISQQMYPIRITDTYAPISMNKISDSCYVFTFPINTAGTSRFTVQGKRGTKVQLIHGERLYKSGHVDISNVDVLCRPIDNSDPFLTDIVTLSGNKDTFTPKFNYKGFQYVEVRSSSPLNLTKSNLVMQQMHSDVPSIGTINSSNELINKMWKAANNSYLSNLFGYPTDCPTREKSGWTGDAQITIEAALYNYDAITVYEKWMYDHQDAQKADGVLPAIIPTSTSGYDWGNGLDWTSSVAIIPWEIYQFYGDNHILKEMYSTIKLYLDHIQSISPKYLTDWGLGDWAPVKDASNTKFIASLYYYKDAYILSQAARMFGNNDDQLKYEQLANNIKEAINNEFLNKETSMYCTGTQTELSAALYFGIVPKEQISKVAHNLFLKIEQDNYSLNIGLLGTKTLLNALSDNGYANAAYKIATKETYPSWGYWIVNGATSFYEHWNIERKDMSLNHNMFSEINAWFYKGLGGIYPDEKSPGFKHIILKPNFVDGLNDFSATHRSPYGTIVSSWKRTGNSIHYDVEVPSNTTATLTLNQDEYSKIECKPKVRNNENSYNLPSGHYKFTLTAKTKQ